MTTIKGVLVREPVFNNVRVCDIITDTTHSQRLSDPHTRRRFVPLGWTSPTASHLSSFLDHGTSTPTPDTRTDTGLPSNGALNESDPPIQGDTRIRPPSLESEHYRADFIEQVFWSIHSVIRSTRACATH